MSIRWEPGENSLLKGSKEGKILLNLLSMLTIGPLIFKCWLAVSVSKANQQGILEIDCLDLRSNLKIWL